MATIGTTRHRRHSIPLIDPVIAGSFSVDTLPDPIQASGHRALVRENPIIRDGGPVLAPQRPPRNSNMARIECLFLCEHFDSH